MSYFPSILQNVIVDTTNSLSAGTINNYSIASDIWNYAGVGSSTLGVNAIQVVVTSTQNLTIYVDQGDTSSAFQITDTYSYLTTKQFGITIQAVGAYVRVRAKNTTGSSATVTIDTVLCPIVEALPRSLDSSGYLQSAIKNIEDGYGFDVENTPSGEMRTTEPVRLAGVAFEGSTIDPNFWTSTVLNGGTTIQANGRLDLLTNTSANGTAYINSVRKARYIPASTMAFRSNLRVGDTGTANNARMWGVGLFANNTITVTSATVVVGDVYSDISSNQLMIMISATSTTLTVYSTGTLVAGARTYTKVSGNASSPATLVSTGFATTFTITDGYYFQLSGTTFSVVSAIGGSPTPVNSGSFNGDLGTTWIPSTNVTTYEIYWNSKDTFFVIGSAILHKMSNGSTPLSNSQTLHIGYGNVNSGGSTTAAALYVRSASIRRLGPLNTAPMTKYITGAATTILKYGAGVLHIVANGANNGTIILYDGLSANAPIIASLDATRILGSVNFSGAPFFNGLTVVTTGTPTVTVVYE